MILKLVVVVRVVVVIFIELILLIFVRWPIAFSLAFSACLERKAEKLDTQARTQISQFPLPGQGEFAGAMAPREAAPMATLYNSRSWFQDEHLQDELPPGDGRDPRQVEFSISFEDAGEESGRGFGDSLEGDGFFSGNPLPRPPGLVSLGDLDDPPPSGGFEPDPPVGGPAPFSIPELSVPFTASQFARPPGFPAPRSPAQSSAPPPSPPRPPEAKEAPLRADGSHQGSAWI